MVVEDRRVARLTKPQSLPEGSRRAVSGTLKGDIVSQERGRMGRKVFTWRAQQMWDGMGGGSRCLKEMVGDKAKRG